MFLLFLKRLERFFCLRQLQLELFFLFVIEFSDALSFMNLEMLLKIELGSTINGLCRPILLVWSW